MARPLRIAYPGAWYHVMNRGLERRNIFLNDHHRHKFLALLNEITVDYMVEIHSYCLMDNHYHLLLRTPLGNISRAMRHLDGVYTQRFNKLTQRDGPLFRGRFKAKLVEADNYLLQLSRYIHLNPVEAKIVEDAACYPWSSYAAYIDRANKPAWLVQTEVKRYFECADFCEQYCIFVERGNEKCFKALMSAQKSSPILGCESFVEKITARHLKRQHCIAEIPEHRLVLNIPQFVVIIEVVASYYAVSNNDILQSTTRRTKIYRAMAIYLSRYTGILKYSEISKNFVGLGESAIQKIYKNISQSLVSDSKLYNDYQNLSALLCDRIRN